MDNLFRDSEPEDEIRDALVAHVLYYAHEYGHTSIKEGYLEKAFILHLQLMTMEGADLSKVFYGDDHKILAVRNALSTLRLSGAMFSKIPSFDDRSYFEFDFERQAKRLIAKSLSKDLLEISQRVMNETLQVLTFGTDAERILEYWKRKKEKTLPSTAAS